MKSKRSILLLLMLSLTTSILLLYEGVQNVKAAPTPLDWVNPEPNGRNWDFDNDTLIGWRAKTLEGDGPPEYDLFITFPQ